MATYSNTTNQIAILKELYPGDVGPNDLVYKKNPLLAMLPKDESPSGFAGKYIPCPIIFGTPAGGRSATFSNAQSNQTPPQLASFFVYRVKNYQLVTIENELIEATRDDAGSFVREVKLNMDTGFRSISNDLAFDLYGDGSGSRGMISSINGSGVIVLTQPNQVVNFEIGMVLVSFSVSGTTATQSTAAALGYVVGVNRSQGIVTVSATAGGAGGLPTNWSTSFPNLAAQGDVSFASGGLATALTLKVSGLAAWGPQAIVGSGDLFWNVNRSQDSRLQFVIAQNTASETIEEALIDGASLVAREGGMPDMCFINFTSYAALEKSLGSKVQYVDVKHEEADIAFAGIRIHAPYGPITVIPDRNCPSRTAYLLQLDTLKFRSLGRAPHILTYGLEGLEGLRVGNADALEIRIGYYGNLTCSAPGWNCVVPLNQ